MENLTAQNMQVFSVPHAMAFEVTVVITSAIIIITSGLVIKQICEKDRRSRTDILFITASVSDVGVGLIRVPLGGLLAACGTFIKCSELILLLIIATDFFPSFSHTVTMVIAVDRLLAIKEKCSYNKFVTIGRLKIIIAFCFVTIIGYTFLSGYYPIYHRKSVVYLLLLRLCTSVVFPLILIVAYIYILFYVHKRSAAVSHFKVSGNNNNKRLNKTIMLILVSQVILTLPSISVQLAVILDIIIGAINVSSLLYYLMFSHWFTLLFNWQFFVNGVIFLINQKKKNNKKIKPAHVQIKKI